MRRYYYRRYNPDSMEALLWAMTIDVDVESRATAVRNSSLEWAEEFSYFMWQDLEEMRAPRTSLWQKVFGGK